MLRPIPQRILTHSITFRTCTGVDAWGEPTRSQLTVNHVCMQPSSETKRTKSNTEVVLRSLLFVDAVNSSPAFLDIDALKDASEAAGDLLRVDCGGKQYTVQTVDSICDDTGRLHHTEVGLV